MTLSCQGLYAQTAFDVNSVKMPLGDLHLLGKSQNGVQLWYSDETITEESKLEYIILNDDDNQKLRWAVTKTSGFYGFEGYNLADASGDDGNTIPRNHTALGENIGHYFSLIGERNALYGGRDESDGTWKSLSTGASDMNLCVATLLEATAPAFDESEGKYKQTLTWNVDGAADYALSELKIMMSCDGGSSWTEVPQTTNVASDSVVVTLPWTATKVRYYAIATLKDKFKWLLTDNSSLTSSQTVDYTLDPIPLACKLSVSGIGTNLTDAEKVYDRSYRPEATWSISDCYADAIGQCELQYCLLNNDNDWHTILTTTASSGTQTVNIPVGFTLYRFRMVVKPQEEYKQFGDSTVTTIERNVQQSITTDAYNSFALNGKIDYGYNYDVTTKTENLNLKLDYALSFDFHATRVGKARISYSTDEGSTWTLAKTLDSVTKTGSVDITIPATATQYMFRMDMASCVDNVITTGIAKTTDNYTFTKPKRTTITLDDSQDYKSQSQSICNAKVMRSFVSGRMGTVCLPFDLTEAQIAEGFGENAEVYDYTSINGSTLNFSKVTTMTAGKPYLVKTAVDKDYLFFTDVSISSDAQPQPSTIDDSYVFTGTFSPYSMATDQSELFLSASGLLKYPSSSDNNANRIRGYRCYFVVKNSSNAKISFDGEMTDIDNVDIDSDEPLKVYNLNGMYVGDSVNNLPKGVYVANGKKIIIK